MSNLHYVTNEINVLKASIIDLEIKTQDTDADGYLLNNGTNRSLALGIDSDGTPIIYMQTNGDDSPLYDDLEDARAWCLGMGDYGEDDESERMRTGANRLLEAVATVERIYEGNDQMLEEMDWYRDKANEVLASIGA